MPVLVHDGHVIPESTVIELARNELGLEVVERRVCGPDDALSSSVTVRRSDDRGDDRTLQLLAWTVQPWVGDDEERAGSEGGAAFVRRRVRGLRDTELPLTVALSASGARSTSVDLAEPSHDALGVVR